MIKYLYRYIFVIFFISTLASSSSIAQTVIEVEKDIYYCELNNLFDELNWLESSIPKRKEFEKYDDYKNKIKPIERRIKKLMQTTFYTTIKFRYSDYDMVNHFFEIYVSLPFYSIRKNDLKFSKVLKYIYYISSNQADELKGKFPLSKMKIYFKIKEDKKILIEKSQLIYFDNRLKEWE